MMFFSPLAYRDPLHCNMNRLFVMLLKDSLTEYAYDAELAGLKYNVDVSIYGINVSKRTGVKSFEIPLSCTVINEASMV